MAANADYSFQQCVWSPGHVGGFAGSVRCTQSHHNPACASNASGLSLALVLESALGSL